MRKMLIFMLFLVSVMARPMEHNLELLLEEEILLDQIHRELEQEIANEEKKMKRELRGEENVMNFFTDYSKRFPYGQTGLSQYRPGR